MTDTTIVKTVFFKASVETVWSFLTDKEKLGQWYHPAKNDLQAGSDYVLLEQSDDGSLKEIIWGRVLEMSKPHRMVQTFCIRPFGEAETKITWQLEECLGGTMLTLRHEGIAEAAGEAALGLLCALDAGWDEHLAHYREVANG